MRKATDHGFMRKHSKSLGQTIWNHVQWFIKEARRGIDVLILFHFPSLFGQSRPHKMIIPLHSWGCNPNYLQTATGEATVLPGSWGRNQKLHESGWASLKLMVLLQLPLCVCDRGHAWESSHTRVGKHHQDSPFREQLGGKWGKSRKA